MDLSLTCILSPSENSKLFFVHDRGLVIDSTYLKDDIPKQKISLQLSSDLILNLYGSIDAVLSGNSNWDTVVNNTAQTSITVRLSKTAPEKIYEVKLEKHGKDSKFVSFIDTAKSLHIIRGYLQTILLKTL